MKKLHKLKYLVACMILAQAPNAYSEDLFTIYQQALEADPESKAAAISVEISKEQTGAALGEMLPQISGSANWSGNDNTNPAAKPENTTYMGTRYFVSLNQTIFDFGKFWNWQRAKHCRRTIQRRKYRSPTRFNAQRY